MSDTQDRHPCSDALDRTASTETQDLPPRTRPNDHINPQIPRKNSKGVNSRIGGLALARASLFKSNYSLFFLFSALIHAAGILMIANMRKQRNVRTMAELEIGAVELKLSDSAADSAPSPPPTPPETVPDTPIEPQTRTPEITPPQPKFEPRPIPKADPINLSEPEITEMTSAEQKPPRIEPQEADTPMPYPKQPPNTKSRAKPQPPEITPAQPKLKAITIPEPEAVVLPDPKPEPPNTTSAKPTPPRVEIPAARLPPRRESTKPTQQSEQPVDKQPRPDTPPSQSPESGAAAAMIDHPPKPRRAIKPRYPAGARRRGEEGAVTLNVEINASGRARDVSIAKSSGFSVLDNAAKQAVSKARFTPGRHNGKNVDSQARLTIIFKLR